MSHGKLANWDNAYQFHFEGGRAKEYLKHMHWFSYTLDGFKLNDISIVRYLPGESIAKQHAFNGEFREEVKFCFIFKVSPPLFPQTVELLCFYSIKSEMQESPLYAKINKGFIIAFKC